MYASVLPATQWQFSLVLLAFSSILLCPPNLMKVNEVGSTPRNHKLEKEVLKNKKECIKIAKTSVFAIYISSRNNTWKELHAYT